MHPKYLERDKMDNVIIERERGVSELCVEAMDEWVDEHRWSAYVLAGVVFGVVSVVAITAPGALQGPYRILRQRPARQQVLKTRMRLKRKGYIALERRPGGGSRYVLTKKGERKLAKFLLESLRKKKKQRWDNRWRILLYDIPEKHRKYRDRMRQIIRWFGCYQLQKNVWIYPYPNLHKLLEYLHMLYGNGMADMVVLEVKRFEEDEKVKKFFQL